MKTKSRRLKRYNFEEQEVREGVIKGKPYGIIFFFLFLGIAILFTKFYVVGVVIIGIFLYYLLFVKDVVLVEFYDTHAIFYMNNGSDECYIVFWDEVVDWQISFNKSDLDELMITLVDHSSISLKCLGRNKIKKYFEKHVAKS